MKTEAQLKDYLRRKNEGIKWALRRAERHQKEAAQAVEEVLASQGIKVGSLVKSNGVLFRITQIDYSRVTMGAKHVNIRGRAVHADGSLNYVTTLLAAPELLEIIDA